MQRNMNTARVNNLLALDHSAEHPSWGYLIVLRLAKLYERVNSLPSLKLDNDWIVSGGESFSFYMGRIQPRNASGKSRWSCNGVATPRCIQRSPTLEE